MAADNPYLAPKATRSRGTKRIAWSLTFKLFLAAVGSVVVSLVCVVAGIATYFRLANGFDYQNGSSRELAKITEPASYWAIPALAALALASLLGMVSCLLLLAKWRAMRVASR